MADLRARVRVLSSNSALFPSVTVTMDRDNRDFSDATFPCKEWCVLDDMMNVSDTASFTIANARGAASGKIRNGMRVELDESDPAVADGQWVRHFTGRVTNVASGSGAGGSTIMVTMMDLGWHLTSCDAAPLTQTSNGTILNLFDKLLDTTWGIKADSSGAVVVDDGIFNRKLKQGRAGVQRAFAQKRNAMVVLPYIQVEPGQKPIDILRSYLAREGYLLNVGAHGEVMVFRPDYREDTLYAALEYHDVSDPRSAKNNLVGRPALTESIDGVYSEVQCWSTVVNPTEPQQRDIARNPNAIYRKESYRPDANPLPFERLSVFMDAEAITPEMRKNRAIWKYQMDALNSWQYEAEVRGHSSGGAFLVSNAMVPVHDSFHGVDGTYYIQSARRSVTEREGARTKLVLRKPVLDPSLQAQLGAGARKAAQ